MLAGRGLEEVVQAICVSLSRQGQVIPGSRKRLDVTMAVGHMLGCGAKQPACLKELPQCPMAMTTGKTRTSLGSVYETSSPLKREAAAGWAVSVSVVGLYLCLGTGKNLG